MPKKVSNWKKILVHAIFDFISVTKFEKKVMKQNKEKTCQNNIKKLHTDIEKKSSMSSLITWNITKALEIHPDLNLKNALVIAQERLEQNPREVSRYMSEGPEGRHLTCALLAWQQLGHRNSDSLHQFYETRKSEKREVHCGKKHCINELDSSRETANFRNNLNYYEPQNEYIYSVIKNEKLGYSSSPVVPVIKLPIQTKIVMRLDNTTAARQSNAKVKSKEQDNDIMTKIDAACCIDSGCAERLAAVEATTNELRTRAIKLARREAERVELLERAEAAWKDLELGYERRLTLAEEKEDDLTKQIKKIIEDRNGYKNDCTTMAEQLKCEVEAAEKDRSRLKDVEKEINSRACIRLKLSEEMARGDVVLADAQCKSAQLTRDLRFKEEQVRRKLTTISSDAESARTLSLEAERAMRDELGALRDQMTNVSNQLLEEDAENCKIKKELEQLRQTKLELVEDLEGCKIMCDDRMQGKLDELKSKKEELKKLKEKVIDCQCKLPIDVTVEVKRTPSLAAMCSCSPDKMMDSCSCTSLRSKLFSNLLSDLFRGLQEELGDIGSKMPCQLLKCLEDKYNWDRSSVVKNNIKNYFSTLLTGELDIAIGTSIEKYHAQWIGASCVDEAKSAMETEDTNESWQQHAIECRAQKLATQLAEQLFQQQADQIVQQARDFVKSSHPCDCKPLSVTYPFLVNEVPFDGEKLDDTSGAFKRFVRQDLTQYRVQLEDLKKVQHSDRAVFPNNEKRRLNNNKPYLNSTFDKNNENRNFNTLKKTAAAENKLSKVRSKNISSTSRNHNDKQDKFQKVKNSFAVNLCLCDTDKKDTSKVSHRGNAQPIALNKDKVKVKQKVQRDSKDFVAPQISSIKQTKPINTITSSSVIDKLQKNGTSPVHRSCQSGCVCLHKIPSNTSIDALLKTLATYKNELSPSEKVVEENVESVTSPVNSPTKRSLDRKNKKDSDSKPHEVEKKQECMISKSSKIPKITESEYMGTINYEKSCKCFTSDIMERKLEVDENHTLRSSYKCINSAECQCGKNMQSDKITSEQQTMPKLTNDLSCFTQTSKTQTEKSIQELIPEKKSNIETKSNNNDIHVDDPCVCNLSINLLGVTLTDTTSQDDNKVSSDNNKQKHVCDLSNFHDTTRRVHHPETISTKIFKINSQDAVINDTSHGVNLKKGNIPLHENMTKINATCHNEIFAKEKQKESSSLCSSNTTNIDSKDLEENTFFLLEKYLRKKLQELKATCETDSIAFQDEEKIMLNILKKIKATISEAQCKISCTCSTGELPEGSWSRAYSLLQEYIKAKMKRAQCTCALDTDTTKTKCMDELLSRISSLIEYDFRRIQELYKNRSDGNINEDIPEKDINHTMIQKYKKSIELLKSDQLGIKTETNTMSCQAFIVNDKKMVDSATKGVQIGKMSNNNISKLVGFDLDEENFCRSISGNLASIGKVLELLVDKVLPNESNNTLQNKANTYSFQPDNQADVNQKDKYYALSLNRSITDVVIKNTSSNLTDPVEPLPYIGCTIDCICDKNVGSCICIKSAVKQNTSKITDLWSTFLRENNKYVLDTTRLMDNMLAHVYSGKEKQVFDLETSEEQQQLVKKEDQTCETMTDAPSVDNIILKVSAEVCNVTVNSNEMTNTFDDSDTLETCLSDNDIEEWSEVQPSFKLRKSIDNTKPQLHSQIHENVELKSDTTGLTSRACVCNKVPVCHVKLLVDNIEQKLMQSECICDSLCSNVCPIHSLKYF